MSAIPIQIDGVPWRIKGDRYQWSVERQRLENRAANTYTWKFQASCLTLSGAVDYLFQRVVREANVEGVAEILKESKRLARLIERAVGDRIRIAIEEV